ncbi:MAG: LytTR family DNA-binding domain-containing protein [Bacteroidota bacterium]
MIKAIIIDDEAKARKAILNILAKHPHEVEVVAQADGVKSGMEAISQFNPDLILLDIQLSDGTGFDLLKKLGDVDVKIIFITAYDKFAIRAFKFSATDYILKPINPSELVAAIQKASEQIRKQNMNVKLNILLSNFEKEEKTIVLKTAETLHVVHIKEIVRCEADGNYTKFYFSNGSYLLVSKSLKEFDDLLSDYYFFRAHNAHLINLHYLQRCDRTKGGMAYMKDGSSVPVALARKQQLLEVMQKI